MRVAASSLLILASVLILTGEVIAQQSLTSALVHIICVHKETVSGRSDARTSGIGAGFFINKTGLLLTAYHVVQGAEKVTVYTYANFGTEACVEHPETDQCRPKACLNPSLVAYDEHLDLAELKCDPQEVITALPIAEKFEPLPLEGGLLYGHANGNLNQRSPVSFPSQRVTRSDRYSVGAVEFAFAPPGVELIRLESELEKGVSGGPVILNDKAIGVLSGGQKPDGRQYGWAIPARAYRDLRPSSTTNFTSLPPLTLLAGGSTPRGYLKVAMPEGRLRLLTESAAQLSITTARAKSFRANVDGQRSLEAFRDGIRHKKVLGRSEVSALLRFFWGLDHTTAYPGERVFIKAAQEGRVGSEMLGLMSSVFFIQAPLFVPIGEELTDIQELASTIRLKLDGASPDDQDAAAAHRLLPELESAKVKWQSNLMAGFTGLADSMEPARRLRAAYDRFASTRSGVDAAVYIDDVLAMYRSSAAGLERIIDLLEFQLQLIENAMAFNANPFVLEAKLTRP